MRLLNTLKVVLVLLAPFSVLAQGYVFTWHGDSGYFQASFEVTAAEMQPGSTFNSSLFTNSIAISSLDGLLYTATNTPNPMIGATYTPPIQLSFILIDQATLSRIEATAVPGQGSSIVEDSPLPNGRHGESGFWTFSQVPEPSLGAMLALGSVMFYAKRRMGRNAARYG